MLSIAPYRPFPKLLRSTTLSWPFLLLLFGIALILPRAGAATPPIDSDGGDSRAQSVNVSGNGARTPGTPKSGQGSIASINTATGNKLTTIPLVGWACRGGMSVGFSLYHNSRGDLAELFAAKWRYSYDSYIVRSSPPGSGTFTIHWDDGSGVTFSENAVAPAGEFGSINADTTTASNSVETVNADYTYTSKDQIRYGFDASHGNFLVFVMDRNGNAITIDRQSSYPWNVTRITDPTGRQLFLNWTPGQHLNTLTDSLSRVWTFHFSPTEHVNDENTSTINNALLESIDLPAVTLYNGNSQTSFSYAFAYNSKLQGSTEPDGNITGITDPNGNTTTYAYNDGTVHNALTDVYDAMTPTPNHSSILYNNNLQVIATDPNGNQSTQSYNSNALLANEVDALGITTGTYSFDSNYNLQSVTDGRNLTWRYYYTPTSGTNLIAISNPDGQSTAITYTALNDPHVITDALNHTTTINYTNGNASSVVDGNNNPTTITVPSGSYGLPSATADALGNTAQFQYDGNGNVNYVLDCNGIQHWFSYYPLGWLQSDSDVFGNTTAYYYDTWGRLITVRKGGSGQVPLYRLDGEAGCLAGGDCSDDLNRIFTTDTSFQGSLSAGGWITDGSIGYAYLNSQAPPGLVAMHRLSPSATPGSGQQIYVLAPNLSQYTAAWSDQGIVCYIFPTQNAAGSLLPMYSAYNSATQRYLYTNDYFEYASLAAPWQSNGDSNGVFCYLQSQAGSLVTTATYAYDQNSNTTSVRDGNGNGVNMTYDADNRLLTRTNTRSRSGPSNVNDTVSYVYDQPNPISGASQKGLLTYVQNGNGAQTIPVYDADARVTYVQYPDGSSDDYAFDNDSNIAAHNDGNSVVSQFGYDNENRLVQVMRPSNGPKGGNSIFAYTNTFTYDAAGRMTGSNDMTGTYAYGYDSANNLTALTTPNGWINYQYYANNQLHVKTGSVGAWTYTYSAVASGNPGTLPSTAVDPYGATTHLYYDATGRLGTKVLGNNQYAQYSYDDQSRVTSIQYLANNNSQTPFAEFDYTYDAGGRILTKLRGYDNQLSTFTYDGADQLTNFLLTDHNGSQLFSESFVYDGNGNRSTRNLNGVTDTFYYDAADKLVGVTGGSLGTRSYSYDGDGQPTGYTLNGQQAVTYDFDYAGNMVDWNGYTNGSLTTQDVYRYNSFGLVMQIGDSTGGHAIQADGVTPGSPVLSDGNAIYNGADSLYRNGVSTYFSNDLLGSVEDVSGGTGTTPTHVVEYDPFGNVLAGSGSNVGSPFRYCGAAGYQTSPDSGLMLAGSRWYDPAIGRFLTRDPAGSGNNPYAYCGNNPISSMDPLGLQSEGSVTPPDDDGGSSSTSFSLSDGWNWFKNQLGIGHHSESPSKPTQGLPNVVFNLTHGPWGGGISGIFNNALDAHTYGLPYYKPLAGTDYITAIGLGTANVAGQFALAYATHGESLASEGLSAGWQNIANFGEMDRLGLQISSVEGLAQLESGGGRIILGAGAQKELRVSDMLAQMYGGTPAEWAKVSSTPGRNVNGIGFSIHAYKNVSTGEIFEPKTVIDFPGVARGGH